MRFVLPLLGLALASPALAASMETAPTKAELADPNALRCRSIREVGSRIPQRVCKTNAQWKEEEEAARKLMQNRVRSSSCGNSNVC